MKRLLVLLLVSSCSSKLFAQTDKVLPSVEASQALSALAIKDAAAGKYRAAFNRFRAYWPLPEVEIDQAISRIEQGMVKITNRFGKSLGFVFVSRQSSGDFLIRFIYAQKFQNGLVRWSFTYYRPDKHWVVLGVSFDDDYDSLLKKCPVD